MPNKETDVPVLAGRAFAPGDFDAGRTSVLINRTLASRLASEQGGLLGQRIRFTRNSDPEAWHEIVGVVADLPANDDLPRLYQPMTPGQTNPLTLTFRSNPRVEGTAERLRAIGTSLYPAVVVDEISAFDTRYQRAQSERMARVYALAIVTLSVLLLSAAGIYALMSFTVNQRRREIGLRSALGAPPLRLLAGTFRGPHRQICAGVAAGLIAAYFVGDVVPIETLGGRRVPGVLVVAGLCMLIVGTLAVAGPARCALRLAPTEALREAG
jgi:hypothetical protein